jgi:hypothetical protein
MNHFLPEFAAAFVATIGFFWFAGRLRQDRKFWLARIAVTSVLIVVLLDQNDVWLHVMANSGDPMITVWARQVGLVVICLAVTCLFEWVISVFRSNDKPNA